MEEENMIKKTTDLGDINLSLDVVASITGSAATECYGVVGMSSQKVMKDGFYALLKKENYSKGIVVEDGEIGTIINVYIIVGYGIKISEIVYEVQKKVKYVLESTLDIDVEAVNVFVQSIKVMD
jgi:Uncharacterized protein conserved in bacteria